MKLDNIPKICLSITILTFCVWSKTVAASDSIAVETNKTISNITQMLPALQLINRNNNTNRNYSSNVNNNNNNNSKLLNANNSEPLNSNNSHIQTKNELPVNQPKAITTGDLNNKNKDNNIFYTHNDNTPKRCAYENVVMNHTFALNKRAGVFTHLGHTRDIHKCKQMCCQVCNV